MKGNHYWIPPSDGMTQLHGLRNTVCCTVHKFMLKLTKLKKPTVSVNMTQKQSFFPGSSFQMDWGNIENFPVVQQTKYEIIFRKHRWCVLQTKKGPGTVHLVISTQFNTLKLMLLKYVSHYGIYSLHICTGFRPTYDPIHVTSFQGRPCTVQQFNIILHLLQQQDCLHSTPGVHAFREAGKNQLKTSGASWN